MRREKNIRQLRTLVETLTRESSRKYKIISKCAQNRTQNRKKQYAELLTKIEVIERDRKHSILKKQLRKEERVCKNLRLRLDKMKQNIALQAGDDRFALKILPQLSREAVRNFDDEMRLGKKE
jgi:predicted RNase H-like nuclease (RuvC/YqgF family)